MQLYEGTGFKLFVTMHGAEYDDWIKARVRGPLTAAQKQELERFLATNPALKQQWEEDLAVHLLTARLPKPELSSNFTAQVLRQIKTQPAPAKGRWAWRWPSAWARPLAYASLAAAMVAGGLHYQREAQRAELAESAATVTAVARLVEAPREKPTKQAIANFDMPPLPPVDIWQNFDAIRALPEEVDTELLIALQ